MARDIGDRMILAEWLFVKTVDDVRRRSRDPRNRDRYELLGIAPLLRKLLLDSPSLLQTVRTVRPEVPVDFRIRAWRAEDPAVGGEGLQWYLRLGGEELVGDDDTPGISAIEEFTSTVIGFAADADLTVRSVIRYYSHVEGGVHFGVPKEAGEQTLRAMAPMLLGRTTGQIEILARLGRIVSTALTPLQDSILAEPTIHRLWHRKNDQGRYEGHWTTDYDPAR